MKYSSLYMAALFGIFLATGCKKDDTTDPNNSNGSNNTAKTKTELLTAGKWQITAETENWTDEDGQEHNDDIYAEYENCEKDDFLVFNTDGNVTTDEGATKCDAGDPQTTTSKWKFENNEALLSVTDSEDQSDWFQFEVVEITSSNLKLKYSYDDGGITSTTHVTYTNIN